MAIALYRVSRSGNGWMVRFRDRDYGPYPGREDAIGAAVEAARKAAQLGFDAEVQVLASNGGEHWLRVWPAGAAGGS